MISYSIPKMLTRASSLSRCTLFVLPFHRVNVLRLVLRALRRVHCRVRFFIKITFVRIEMSRDKLFVAGNAHTSF